MPTHSTRNAAAFVLLAAFLIATPSAHAEDARPEDTAAVNACLKLVESNQRTRVPGAPGGTSEERPGASGRLAAAQDAAPREAVNCIGVVANACLHADGTHSNAAMNDCHTRETAVWDARLNAAYKKALAGAEPDAADGFRKVQRAWIAFRDAACLQPHVVYKGTMAGPMGVYCMMEKTARQALWLEGWVMER